MHLTINKTGEISGEPVLHRFPMFITYFYRGPPMRLQSSGKRLMQQWIHAFG